jgi:hypothetical protein
MALPPYLIAAIEKEAPVFPEQQAGLSYHAWSWCRGHAPGTMAAGCPWPPEVPGVPGAAPEAGSVMSEGGWLTDGPGPEPDTTPLRKPEPLPDGVAGYVVWPWTGTAGRGRAGGSRRPT